MKLLAPGNTSMIAIRFEAKKMCSKIILFTNKILNFSFENQQKLYRHHILAFKFVPFLSNNVMGSSKVKKETQESLR